MPSLALLPLAVLAQAAPPHLQAQRTAAPPAIDGRLDDAVWDLAPASDAFVQRFPDEGQPPSEATSVRVLYDDHALYVGVRCEQRRSPVRARLTRRDRVGNDADSVSVVIDSRGDGSSAFAFGVSAAGVLSDGLWFNDTAFDPSWDENWEGAAARTADGWSAELRIPLRVLRFPPRPVQSWGFNVHRFIAARQETDDWAPLPRAQAGYVSLLGRLEGLVGLQPPRADLELRPFVVGKLGRQDAGLGPLRAASGPLSVGHRFAAGSGHEGAIAASAGLDARWHLTRDLTLEATVNPDFGQVEADQVVLNLSTVELFYPEKRPFFLEGLDLFATPLGILYTRRVGAMPAVPDLPAGETATEGVLPSAIPAAVKLAGRVGGGVSAGLLSAVTSANEQGTRDAQGAEHVRLAAPTTTFNVLRLKSALGAKADGGLMLAATNRLERPADYPRLVGGLACPGQTTARVGSRCFRDAYVGALDGRWRSPGGDYVVQGQVAGSLLEGGQPVQLRDGTVLGPGSKGLGALLWANKEGGRHFLFNTQTTLHTRAFELNDAGYLPRQNTAGANVDLIWATRQPWGPTLETASALELRHWRNLDGLTTASYGQITTWWHLRNEWRFYSLLQYRAPYFDDREVGEGTALEHAGMFGWELTVAGDPRRAFTGELFGRIRRRTNGWWAELDGGLVARTAGRLELELLPSLSYTAGEPRYVEEHAGGLLLFGRLRAAQVGATLRLTYAFTPRLTLQGYGQLFLASGRYTAFSSYQRPPGTRPAIRLRDLLPGGMPATDPDFQEAALNATVVLRWEWRLGSTLYVVYSRAQTPTIDLHPGDVPALDVTAVPRAPAADVLLVKLAYWWG